MMHLEPLASRNFQVKSKFGLVARMLALTFVGIDLWIGVAPLFMNLSDWVLGNY